MKKTYAFSKEDIADMVMQRVMAEMGVKEGEEVGAKFYIDQKEDDLFIQVAVTEPEIFEDYMVKEVSEDFADKILRVAAAVRRAKNETKRKGN